MKISILFPILCVTAFFQSAFSQNSKPAINNGFQENSPNQKSAKENYINNMNYLAPNSLKDYTSNYGDSLNGFNEAKIKAELINHGVYGEEYLLHINKLKRNFILNKYNLQTTPKGTPIQNNYNQSSLHTKLIGGSNSVNFAPCVNEDFELSNVGQYTTANAITGWNISSQAASSCNTNTVWNAGSSKFWIVSTPITGVPSIGNLGASPLGGTKIAQLQNNISPFSLRTKLSTTFPVSLANTVFQFAFAGVYNDGGHQCCEQPALQIKMYDCLGNPLTCSSLSLNAVGNGCTTGSGTYTVTGLTSWTNWQTKFIDLTPFVGTCVTIEIINADCIYGGHYGMTFIDARCGGQAIASGIPGPGTPVPFCPYSYCAGSNLATMAAPIGYASYQWFGPGMVPIAGATGTQQILSIPNPTLGAIYTVDLTTASGCVYTSSNSLSTSTVSIVGIGSSPSCIGGASGSATVVGTGSGTGYLYSWLNSSNSIIGTNSVVTGLAPGIYSISISGQGSAGCGTAVSTVTVVNAQPSVINLIKPFCGNGAAYLAANGGSNFQWYNSSGAISANSGGTAQTYSIATPLNGSVLTLTYLTAQNCQDSVRFTLSSTPPGFVNSSNISWVCPGGNNGTAQINMAMAAGSPPGSNSVSILSLGNTPAYNFNVSQSSASVFPITGLSAGTYTVKAFDGSCFYNTTFAVNAFTFNFNVSPNSPTLCPGNCIAAGVSFNPPPSLTQYTYSWSPTLYLTGGIGSNPSTIICPTIALGTQTTIIYTVVVTPSVVNCPVSKTIAIQIINPAIPTFTLVPELCNNSNPYQIQTSIPGGTFSTVFTGTNSPVNQSTGLITPSHSNIVLGQNSFTYAISINTCVAKNSATYEVSKFWTSALSSTVPPLCVTNPCFNLMNIVQNTVNGGWTGPGISSNCLDPSTLNTNTYSITYTCFSSPNPSACPSATNIQVSVTNTMTPLITIVPEFCNNGSPFSMTVNPSGGTWSGASGINSSGLVSPSIFSNTIQTVNYVFPNGPCVNNASTVLHISRFNSAALTATVPNLCYNSAPFNLMSIVQSTINGVWSGLAGVNSNSFITMGLPSNTYIATYSTNSSPNATLCTDSKTIAISTLNPPTPTITALQKLCSNAANVQLNAQPSNGQWTSSTYLNMNGVFIPSLSVIGNNVVYYSNGTATCNVQQSSIITVEAFVSATILSPVNDLCNNSVPINLSPLTLNAGGTWLGDGVSGNYFDPQQSGAGNFTLKYITASSPSGLCPDQAITSVNVYSLAAPQIAKLDVMCNNSLPMQLSVSPVGGMFGNGNLGMISLSGLFNPANAIIGDNLISYSISSGPCIAHAQTIIKVEEFISANLAKQINPFCKTADAVNLNSFVQNPSGSWTGKGLVGSMFYPDKANIGINNILVYTTYSYPSGKFCPDTEAVRIEVRDITKVTADIFNNEGCAPLHVLFNCPSVNEGKGEWKFSDGSKTYVGLDVEHIFQSAGNYTAVFNYIDEIGCKSLPVLLPEIHVFDSPIANFEIPEQAYTSDPLIQAVNLTRNLENNHYEWRISNSDTVITDINPYFQFHKAGKYNIQLSLKTIQNCKSDLTKTILIKNNFNIYIPNAFTPNYDGLNDVFKPVFSEFGLDVSSFSMQITDRWGHQLYSSKNWQKGWNGSKGESSEIVPADVYNYEIRYKDLEGNWYLDRGHISLVN